MDMIRFLLTNQLKAEDWGEIADEMPILLGDHARLIRTLALYVSEGKAGKGEARQQLLGLYYDETQAKVTWAYNTAKDVWKGKYGNGDERRAALGADFDLVQYWVEVLRPAIYVPTNLTYKTDLGGKRYQVSGVPTKRGTITWTGFDQHAQGADDGMNFDGSGCGLMSITGIYATLKGYTGTPLAWARKNLKTVTGGAKCPISLWAGCKLLDHEGISYTWAKGAMTTQTIYNKVKAHLETGQPVIVSLSYAAKNGNGKVDKRYTNYAHYAVLIGVTEGGKGYLLDSGGKKPRYVDLYDLCDHIPTTKASPDYDSVWNGWTNAGGFVLVNM